jgi:hypothetical protein
MYGNHHQKKTNPLYLTSQQLCFRAFPHPHQSPPSSPDRENSRNHVLQVQTPHTSLFKLSRPFLQCMLRRFCPMSILSAAHRRQERVPAVDINPVVFDCHNISTLTLFRHQVTTSALDVNEQPFTWENRCHARAELASCWVSGGSGGNGGISWGGLESMLWIKLLILDSLGSDGDDHGRRFIRCGLSNGWLGGVPSMKIHQGGYIHSVPDQQGDRKK